MGNEHNAAKDKSILYSIDELSTDIDSDDGCIRLVPDFGGWSLDKDSNFSRYCQFCGTINGVHTDRNPNKIGMHH